MKFDLEKLLEKNSNKIQDEFPEDKKRYTDDKRTEARLLAIQAVFTSLKSDKSVSGIINESLEYFGLKSAQLDKKLFVKIAENALNNKEEIIKEVEINIDSNSWSFERIDPVTSSILITSIAELFMKENPVEIIISEYMALANAFVEKKQIAFIHGVLSSTINKYNLGE